VAPTTHRAAAYNFSRSGRASEGCRGLAANAEGRWSLGKDYKFDHEALLKDAASRKPGDEAALTIRELLAHWNALRRGYWIVNQIERDLERHNLTTDPDFTEGWIDNTIRLVPLDRDGQTAVSPGDVESEGRLEVVNRPTPQVSLQVASLPSANLGVVSVTPQDTLERAQSLMMSHDFSQLAVLSGERDLRGALSWESIAQARIRDSDASLQDAIVPAELVRHDDDLLAQIPRVIEAGFVFVQAHDRRIGGIVTTADLSNQFATLANPFFMIAEIERRIRRTVEVSFALEDLRAVADPADTERRVDSVDDLTFGEYVRLVESPERWAQLGWAVDRKVFLDALQAVRKVRNEIMHFSPDPLDDDQVRRLTSFRNWLRKLDPLP
jgi:restriction system protein